MKEFAVKANSFETYAKFKIEAEKLGWEYNYYFNKFDIKTMGDSDSLYFATEWDGYSPEICMFSFSNVFDDTLVFKLPKDWKKAISYLEAEFIKPPQLTMITKLWGKISEPYVDIQNRMHELESFIITTINNSIDDYDNLDLDMVAEDLSSLDISKEFLVKYYKNEELDCENKSDFFNIIYIRATSIINGKLGNCPFKLLQ